MKYVTLIICMILGLVLFQAKVIGAPEHFVYGMKNQFPMSKNEKTLKDFYITMGTDQGIKKGTVLDVYRSITSNDDINNRASKVFIFKFAKLKVLHAETDVAIARLVELLPAKDVPIGEYPSVVIGDRVAVASE